MRKAEDKDWALLKPEVFAAIMDFYASNEPVLLQGEALAADPSAVHSDDSEACAARRARARACARACACACASSPPSVRRGRRGGGALPVRWWR